MDRKKIITLAAILFFWHVIVAAHLVKPIFLPPPDEVVRSLTYCLLTREGISNITSTLARALFGFAIGTGIGVPIGIFLGVFKGVYEYVSWLIDFIRSVPVTAMFPLFLIFFGFGDASKIAMAAWGAGFIVLVNTIHGVWSAKKNRRIMAVTKKATNYQILTKITFCETLPFIFAGMRIGVSWNLIVVVVAEMFIGTKAGLGHLIYDASIVFDTASVMAGIILIGAIGYTLNSIIAATEKKIVHWNGI
ncbi:MAG: ABC transporter permease [Candidatus Altiarchaeota archaeon]